MCDAPEKEKAPGRPTFIRRCLAARPLWMAILLAPGMVALYNNSVPSRFNTVYENRLFFDSDGEFITRQFRQGKTYTHNDHLLYHVLGRWVYDHADPMPLVKPNPVSAHKVLSVVAGALGMALMMLFGWRLTGRPGAALAAAFLVGGCAGYWFFSATIDTYLPNLCASLGALGLALECLRRQTIRLYAALGAAMGLAFLFRTDAFLLAPLVIVLLPCRSPRWPRLVALVVAGLIVGVVGYAVLARATYDVPWNRMVPWALGHADRPEVAGARWGTVHNLSGQSLALALVNQLIYAVVLPGLGSTRSPDMLSVMGTWRQVAAATAMMAFAVLAIVIGTRRAWRDARAGDWTAAVILALIPLWLVPRTVFYAWWDPGEPFLFAVLSLPWLWLAALVVLGTPAPGQSPDTPLAQPGWITALVAVLALCVWAHNWNFMIVPLRAL